MDQQRVIVVAMIALLLAGGIVYSNIALARPLIDRGYGYGYGYGYGDDEQPQTTITGFKWHDENGDGVRDHEEQGIEGWAIALGRVTGPVNEGGQIPIEIVELSLTGSGGGFLFSGVPPGEYKVFEERRDDWKTTNPAPHVDSFFDITYRIGDPDFDLLSFFDVFVEVSGQQFEGLAFGNAQIPEEEEEETPPVSHDDSQSGGGGGGPLGGSAGDIFGGAFGGGGGGGGGGGSSGGGGGSSGSGGSGGSGTGEVLGEETTQEEQIAALQEQLAELQEQLVAAMQIQIEFLQNLIVQALQQMMADLQAQIAAIQAQQ